MKLLVVGCGSIGKRHLGNFKALGVEEVGAVDTRPDRLREAADRFGVSALFGSVEDALAAGWDAVVVGVPTRHHLHVAEQAVSAGAHVLVEKPISDRLEGLEELLEKARNNGLVLMVGYTFRFWPPLRKLKELLDGGAVGRIYSAQVTFSEYLPDWHPWEDYRSWFMASKELGGGAILDESHALDMARWLFGEAESVYCVNDTISHLEITSDDLAEMVVRFRSGVVAAVHMDIFGRHHRKEIAVAGETGNASWDFYRSEVRLYRADEKVWQVWPFTCERNDMFVAEASHFLDCVAGKATPAVDGEDGRRTLELILAAVESSQRQQAIRPGGNGR